MWSFLHNVELVHSCVFMSVGSALSCRCIWRPEARATMPFIISLQFLKIYFLCVSALLACMSTVCMQCQSRQEAWV